MGNQASPSLLQLQLLVDALITRQLRQRREPLPLVIKAGDGLDDGDEDLGVVLVHASFEQANEGLDAHSLGWKCFLDLLGSRNLGLAGGGRFALHLLLWTGDVSCR